MDEFLKMDIFFFVTTVAVVTLAFFFAYVLWRLGRVLKHIEHISEQAALESDSIRQDLAGVRRDIQKGKGRLESLFDFFTKSSRRSARKNS
ncbi:MAG: hypothetical protein WC798_00590 [Candidatus Paceibacterota bacterium]|jgi:hypothetical protein